MNGWPATFELKDENGNVIASGAVTGWQISRGHYNSLHDVKIEGILAPQEELVTSVNGVTGPVFVANAGVTTAKCNHVWKRYVGFTEKFEYCENCQAKR